MAEDQKLHEDDEIASEAEHVPGADDLDVLESDEGVSHDEIHPESADDGIHGADHEAELDASTEDEQVAPAPTGNPATDKNWYIIHAYSGFENKVAESLRTRAQAFGFADRVGQILIPTVEVVELRNGKM